MTTIAEPWYTKYKFKIKANAKQRNMAASYPLLRDASIAGRTIDVTIITC